MAASHFNSKFPLRILLILHFSDRLIEFKDFLTYNVIDIMKGNLSMKFYSYDYVLSQISQQNWVMVAITAGLILVTGVFAFKAFKERHDTKFRELSIISILTLVAVVLIAISNFQSNQSNNDQI